MTPEFDRLASEYPGLADLARRPERSRFSGACALDSGTAIVADCEPEESRVLFRQWDDRGTAEGLAEAVHQMELERAAQPPVIEVTVTTPPQGIPRLELSRLVAEKVTEITGPLPVLGEDDMPTQEIPAIGDDFTLVEVHVP